jgi:glutathione S-transferase
MRLFSGPLSMFGAKAQIAAHEKGLDFELVMVPFQRSYEPKHPEVLRVNPNKQVPVLIDGKLEIFDSTQIFEYFEDRRPVPALWPAQAAARARAPMAQLFGARMGAGMGPVTPKLLEWRERIGARPAVRRVVEPMVGYLVSTGRPVPGFLCAER